MEGGGGREDGLDDGARGFDGGNVGGPADLGSGEKAGTSFGDGKEGLLARSIGEVASEEASEGGKLEGVEVSEERKKREGIACAETVGHLREGKAAAKEAVFELGILKAVEYAKNILDFIDACGNDISGKRNVAYRGSKELIATVGGTRDPTIERVEDGWIEGRPSVDE